MLIRHIATLLIFIVCVVPFYHHEKDIMTKRVDTSGRKKKPRKVIKSELKMLVDSAIRDANDGTQKISRIGVLDILNQINEKVNDL